jgi:hypothetical protein
MQAPLDTLPLYIEVDECQISVDQGPGALPRETTFGPFFKDVIGILPCGPQGSNQNNTPCTKLQQRILVLRNLILTQCGTAAKIRGDRDAAAGVAAAALVAAGVFSALAATAAWPLNLIFGIVAVAFGLAFIIAAIAAAVITTQLNGLLDLMASERTELGGYSSPDCWTSAATSSSRSPSMCRPVLNCLRQRSSIDKRRAGISKLNPRRLGTRFYKSEVRSDLASAERAGSAGKHCSSGARGDKNSRSLIAAHGDRMAPITEK